MNLNAYISNADEMPDDDTTDKPVFSGKFRRVAVIDDVDAFNAICPTNAKAALQELLDDADEESVTTLLTSPIDPSAPEVTLWFVPREGKLWLYIADTPLPERDAA